MVSPAGPLSHALPIVDKDGRPTQQFMRQWSAVRSGSTLPFTQITGTIANNQVPEEAVTQHQGALRINASQVDPGTFGAGSYGITGSLAVNVDIEAGGDVVANSSFSGGGSGGGGGVGELINLSDVIDSTPTLRNVLVADGTAWASRALEAADIQTGAFSTGRISQAAVTQHQGALAIAANQLEPGTFGGSGAYSFVGNVLPSVDSGPNLGSAALRWASIYGVDGHLSGLLTINRASNEHLRLQHQSSTGAPYLAWAQDVTDRASVQWMNAGYLRYNVATASHNHQFYTGGVLRFTIRSTDVESAGDVIANA